VPINASHLLFEIIDTNKNDIEAVNREINKNRLVSRCRSHAVKAVHGHRYSGIFNPILFPSLTNAEDKKVISMLETKYGYAEQNFRGRPVSLEVSQRLKELSNRGKALEDQIEPSFSIQIPFRKEQ
jgi:hypothetical protein